MTLTCDLVSNGHNVLPMVGYVCVCRCQNQLTTTPYHYDLYPVLEGH